MALGVQANESTVCQPNKASEARDDGRKKGRNDEVVMDAFLGGNGMDENLRQWGHRASEHPRPWRR